uniref:Uncharacterized protein n=1 Tax=Arundo donax TaxID=35708 RepID=A0A0A8ZSB5_ARUDO
MFHSCRQKKRKGKNGALVSTIQYLPLVSLLVYIKFVRQKGNSNKCYLFFSTSPYLIFHSFNSNYYLYT